MIPKLILVTGVVFIFGSACTHDVYIRSNPAGAKIYVNDEFIGKSPAVYEESIGAREKVEVRAEKEGFATKTIVLEKSKWAVPQMLASIGGCVCGGLCCGTVVGGGVSDDLGPLALLGGLPALSGLYFARQSDDNLYLKLSSSKTPKFKKRVPDKKSLPDKAVEATSKELQEEQSGVRPLPSGYTY